MDLLFLVDPGHIGYIARCSHPGVLDVIAARDMDELLRGAMLLVEREFPQGAVTSLTFKFKLIFT